MELRGATAPSTLRDYVELLARRKSAILPTLLLVPLVAGFLAARQPAVYRASAEVLLVRQDLAPILAGLPDPNLGQDPFRFAQTQARLARAPEVVQRAIDAAGVEGRTAGGVLGASSVSPLPDTDLLTFAVSDADPKVAERLANAYAREFSAYRQSIDTESLESARQRLQTRITELEAQGEADSELVADLKSRERTLTTLEALQSKSAVVSRRAAGAVQVEPRPRRAALLGAVFGLVLGVALALLFEGLDTRVRSEELISGVLGLPLLGRVPKPPRHVRSKDQLVMLAEPEGRHAEAVRRLRASLEFVKVDDDVGTVMVTSAVDQEGKSTTVANLAVAFAATGRSVALVDFDLRAPSLHRLFRLGTRPGVGEIARGRATVDELVTSVAIATPEDGAAVAPLALLTHGNGDRGRMHGVLEILPAGAPVANPGEFVATDVAQTILDDLRRRADLVLVDAPPLLGVGDARTLSGKVDGLIVVTRYGFLRRAMLRELAHVLTSVPARRLGFVVTDAEGGEASLDGLYRYDVAATARRRERIEESPGR